MTNRKAVNIRSTECWLRARTPETTPLCLLDLLNRDTGVHSILLQLPPKIDAEKVLDAIDPAKNIDGFHPVNTS